MKDDTKESLISVLPYSLNSLVRIFRNKTGTDIRDIRNKRQVLHLHEYCQNQGIKTIVLESDYIDRDYLEDYAAYYSRSFSSYSKKVGRLHFFNTSFTQGQFKNWLEVIPEKKREELESSYCGFMVIRPLPNTFFGKTVLRPPKSTLENSATLAIKKSYTANLSGFQFKTKTIGFLEQEKSVSACATSALWTIFQSTGPRWNHSIPSPVEITRMAMEKAYASSRAFPNNGLSAEQIADCIKALKLDPLYVDVGHYSELKAILYAYLKARIPLILGVSMYNVHEKRFLGEHAIAVVGYKMESNVAPVNYFGGGNKRKQLYLRSSFISSILVHDDQVGPFSEMVFDDPFSTHVVFDEKYRNSSLSTHWSNGVKGKEIRAVPNIVLVPLYPKIRISYRKILEITDKLSFEINHLFTIIEEWEIFLDYSSDLKKEIRESTGLKKADRHELLLCPLPRFIWRVRGYADDSVLIEFLFDATDVTEGHLFIRPVFYDDEFAEAFNDFYLRDARLSLILDKHVRYIISKCQTLFKK